VQPARAENLIPSGRTGSALTSCTGRAVSVRGGGGTSGRADQAGATILIAGPGYWTPASRATAAAAGRRFKAVIAAELDDFLRYNLIKTGIVPARVDREAVAALQALVESDPGILLTVDIGRREVRVGGGLAARFEMDGSAEDLAQRLHMAQRLLGSAGLSGETRIRLQRRLIAICDAVKVPGTDTARLAWRLDLFLVGLARTGEAGQGGGGAAAAGTRCR
jgi:hypothetical protein